jgi:prepilin-type N-terminal cleavage/methylation domain-containing protein
MKPTLKPVDPRAGYTLIEVLVATMILAMASFGLMGLLRASDQMGYRGRVNGVVSTLISTRGRQLVALSYSDYSTLTGGDGLLQFQRGRVSGPNILTFPFLVPGEGGVNSTNYLAYGRPLPGDTIPRGLFPFAEFVTVTTDTTAGTALVEYELTWTDSYSGATGDRFQFSFTKYDPTRF